MCCSFVCFKKLSEPLIGLTGVDDEPQCTRFHRDEPLLFATREVDKIEGHPFLSDIHGVAVLFGKTGSINGVAGHPDVSRK